MSKDTLAKRKHNWRLQGSDYSRPLSTPALIYTYGNEAVKKGLNTEPALKEGRENLHLLDKTRKVL